jgi:hypothetical protein
MEFSKMTITIFKNQEVCTSEFDWTLLTFTVVGNKFSYKYTYANATNFEVKAHTLPEALSQHFKDYFCSDDFANLKSKTNAGELDEYQMTVHYSEDDNSFSSNGVVAGEIENNVISYIRDLCLNPCAYLNKWVDENADVSKLILDMYES